MKVTHLRQNDFKQQQFLLILMTPLQIRCKVEMTGLNFHLRCNVVVLQLRLIEHLQMGLLSLMVV
jgi:hypothetical protein